MNVVPDVLVLDTVKPPTELCEQSADQAPVMPLLRFDLAKALALLRIAQAVPVPAIGKSGGELA